MEAISENIVLPDDANHYNTIFGGNLLAWMDRTAFIAARKYAENDVVTVSVHDVVFKAPVKVGETVKISPFVKYVGRTSIEVCVNVISGNKTMIEEAYFTFVNVDKKGKSVPVMQPDFETAEEKRNFESRWHEKECAAQTHSICMERP